MTEIIKVECPECHEFVELGSMAGTYFGRCKNCVDKGLNVRFSVMDTVSKIVKKQE